MKNKAIQKTTNSEQRKVIKKIKIKKYYHVIAC